METFIVYWGNMDRKLDHQAVTFGVSSRQAIAVKRAGKSIEVKGVVFLFGDTMVPNIE